MTAWTIRRIWPDEADLVLDADVFDGLATTAATLRFLGNPGAADPCADLMMAEPGGRVVGFASGTVPDHPDKPRALYRATEGGETVGPVMVEWAEHGD